MHDHDAAIRWAIRLDKGQLAEAEQQELEAWLAEDERRRGALLRAEATLSYLDRGRALANSNAPVDEVASVPSIPPLLGRRAFLLGGGLTGLAAAAGIAGLLWLPSRGEEIATVRGEVRRVPLPDGSFASLNTASRVSVAFTPERRSVRLEEGEAWYQVAHDRTRPFIVEAGAVRVQAVGTAFSVRRREAGADVLVTEGTVETWVVGREGQRTRISAGARAFISEASAPVRLAQAPDAVDRALAWRTGEIALNGESLSYAVAEINRYNERQIVIADEGLAREPLVGYFRTNEPENFARAVANMVGARMSEQGETIRLDR